MKKNNLRPHVHSQFIKAWADGHKIEVYDQIYSQNWLIEEYPQWHIHSQYRIYDPLREVKEAYENGSTIEQYNLETGKVVLSYNLDEYKEYLKRNTIEGLPIFTPSWNTKWGWRIKPVDDFKVGDLVKEIKSNNVYRIVEKEEDVDRFHLQLSYIQNDNNSFKKATKEEVLNAPNYDGTAINKDFPFEEEDWIIYRTIKKSKVVKFNGFLTPYSFVIMDPLTENHKEIYKYKWYYATKKEIEDHILKLREQSNIPENLKEYPLTPEECFETYKLKDYEPFIWEDREQLKGKWIKHKELKDEELIISLTADEDDWIITHDKNLSGENLLDNYLFLDGSPCGKLKK